MFIITFTEQELKKIIIREKIRLTLAFPHTESVQNQTKIRK